MQLSGAPDATGNSPSLRPAFPLEHPISLMLHPPCLVLSYSVPPPDTGCHEFPRGASQSVWVYICPQTTKSIYQLHPSSNMMCCSPSSTYLQPCCRMQRASSRPTSFWVAQGNTKSTLASSCQGLVLQKGRGCQPFHAPDSFSKSNLCKLCSLVCNGWLACHSFEPLCHRMRI